MRGMWLEVRKGEDGPKQTKKKTQTNGNANDNKGSETTETQLKTNGQFPLGGARERERWRRGSSE